MMKNNLSKNSEQNSKLTVFGSHNSTVVNQVVVNVNSLYHDIDAIKSQLESEIKSVLKEEFVSSGYNVLFCYPNKELDNVLVKDFISQMKLELNGLGAVVYEGGGRINLPNTEITYPHLAELEFIKLIKCDAVIIFALEEVTISQLTLISYFKISQHIDSTDVIIISSDKLRNSDVFFSNGTFKYCDDHNCKFISLESLNDAEIKSVIDRIVRKKIIQRKGGLLGG